MAGCGLSSSVGPNHRGHWVLSRRCKMNRVLYPQIDRAETSCSCQSPRVHGCRGVAMIVHLLSEFQPKVSPVLPAPAVGRRSRQRRKLSTGRGGRFGLVDGCPFNESARNLLHHDATPPSSSWLASFSSGMRDGTGATLRGLAGGWLSGSVRLPLQSYSVSFKSHTHSVTSWWAGGLVGYVLATTAPRCLDMVGAVMLLRCQQAMSLSGVSTPSWCCVGGRRLARHLTARGHLDSSRGCFVRTASEEPWEELQPRR